MFGIVKPKVLQPSSVEVTAVGEQVNLRIGNSSLRMSYEQAITLSQWLRVRGKEAKRFAGDVSRHWHGIAVMNGAPDK